MKPIPLLLTVLALLPLLAGCVTTTGTAKYPSVGLEGVAVATQWPDRETADRKEPPAPPAPSVDELLGQRVELTLPAKVLVVNLGPQNDPLNRMIRDRLNEPGKDPGGFGQFELVFSELVASRNRYGRPTLAEIQQIAARFQAQYALIIDYGFNYSHRVYWLPAAITVGTLGLIPMPVGGEQAFCTVEFVLMDARTTVFVVSAQGRGQALKTSVWGWVVNTDTTRVIDENSLKKALDEAVPLLKDRVQIAAKN